MDGKRGLKFTVAENGEVAVWGLLHDPIKLTHQGWERLLDNAAELRTFIDESKTEIRLKGEWANEKAKDL
jgi:hypothetical protein